MNYNTPVDRLDFDAMEDKPKIRLERRKRGPKKKHIPKAEMELRLMTPRMRDLAEGRLRVEDLDWEELTRGQLRDSRGGFSGSKPAVLPRVWHDQIAHQIVLGAEAKFRENFDLTMEVLLKMISNPRTPARERLAALQYVQERVIGKITERREIKQEIVLFDQLVQSGELLVDLGEQSDDGADIFNEQSS